VSDQDLNDLLKEFDNPHHCYKQSLVDAIRLLVKERDELRCEVCDWVGNHFKEPPQDVAKRNGWNCFDTGVWDCYKEETK
jgi:hypothetical protein